MSSLPSADERDAILERLALVVDRLGYAPLVSAHLLAPRAPYLPAAWSPDRRGVEAFARRLLAFAGLACEVHVVAPPPPALPDEAPPPPIRCEGFVEGTCVIAVDEAALGDDVEPERTLCRAIAQAVRMRRDVVGRDAERESLDVDVTCVHLGFGVLMASGFPSGVAEGAYRTHGRTRPAVPVVAYLLAVQAIVRELGSAARDALAATLDPENAELFRAACVELADDGPALRKRLGVPPREQWPTVAPIEAIVPRRKRVKKATTKKATTKTRPRWKRWVALGVAAAALGGLGVAAAVPRATTVHQLRDETSRDRFGAAILRGRASNAESSMHIVSKDGTVFTSFVLDDGTGSVTVWYELASRERVRSGDVVRVRGELTHLEVDGRRETSFIATSVVDAPSE